MYKQIVGDSEIRHVVCAQPSVKKCSFELGFRRNAFERKLSRERGAHSATRRLTGGALRNFSDPYDRGGNFICANSAVEEIAYLISIDRTAGARDNRSYQFLAQGRVFQREADGFRHFRVREDRAVDFQRIDRVSAALYQFLSSTKNEQAAVFVQPTDISSTQPTVHKVIRSRFSGCIASNDTRSAQKHLSFGAGTTLVT